MEKNIYDITVRYKDGKSYNSLYFFENDNEATKMADSLLRNSRNIDFVRAQRIVECPGTSLANRITIHENSATQKLKLSKKQKDAIKEMYAALEKVQNLGVHLVERNDGALLAFNGNDVKEWCVENCDGVDEYDIELQDLYFAGPSFYEAMAHGSTISVIYK